MLRIHRTLSIAQTPQVVWNRLEDFPRMVSLLPNVTGWAMPDADHFTARLRGKLAWFPVSAVVSVAVVERVAFQRLRTEGDLRLGSDSSSRASKLCLFGGDANFGVDWHVAPAPSGGTTLRYALQISMDSKVEALIRGVVDSRIGTFEARFAAALGGASRREAVAA